jgi:exoribonuclease-2
MKDGPVRADHLPLVFRALGAEALPRGAHVRVKITATDLLTLDVHASVSERLDDAGALPAEVLAEDAVDDTESSEPAGPLTLAIATDDANADGAVAAADESIPAT